MRAARSRWGSHKTKGRLSGHTARGLIGGAEVPPAAAVAVRAAAAAGASAMREEGAMHRSAAVAISCALALAGLASGSASAADSKDSDAPAVAALQKMSAYLRSLTAFHVQAVTTDEDVLEDGQKIQYSGTADVLARTPGHLWAEVVSDRKYRILYYDGKTLSLYAPRVGYYASIAAPPTIAQLAKTLDNEYDLAIPLEDLFLWGSAGWNSGGIESVMDVGPSQVNGTTCEQYAVRQKDIDWQIWVQLGPFPLPRKIVISNRTDEERPEHTVVYTWDLAPSFNDATFAFTPPPGVHRVPLAKASLAANAPAAGAAGNGK